MAASTDASRFAFLAAQLRSLPPLNTYAAQLSVLNLEKGGRLARRFVSSSEEQPDGRKGECHSHT